MISMSSSTTESIPSDLLDILKNDPVKRGLVLQLIAQERDGFNAYKKKNPKLKGPPSKNEASPLKKLQKTSRQCNSPTTLLRKRALLKRNQEIASESSSSELSEAQAETSSVPSIDPQAAKVPFEELLEGVIAYVEVKRNNLDKSSGIKAIMKWMGATIKDTFTSDVTHVVFKDGSFHTYQKAKLMKIHLVSVLWLEAIRKHNVRVPEKNYPAFGGEHCDNNISMLCSQLQKDYEDIVKDEKRRSLASQLPLSGRNSKNSLENRRRTLMTPSTSTASFQTAAEKQSPPSSKLNDIDEEIENISKNAEKSFIQISSPELTSDESDCGGVVDGYSSRHLKDKFFQSLSQGVIDETPKKGESRDVSHATVENSDLPAQSAEHEQSTKTVINRGRNTAKDKRKNSDRSVTPVKNDISTRTEHSVKVDSSSSKIDTTESEPSNSLFLRPPTSNRRKTINVISDMVITPNVGSMSPKIIKPSQKQSLQKNLLEDLNKSNLTKTLSDQSTNISNDEPNILKTIQDLTDNTVSSSLGVTHKDSDKSNKVLCLTREDKENLSSGSLRTTMSSLRLSDENHKGANKNQKKSDDHKTSLDKSNDNPRNDSRRDGSNIDDSLKNSVKKKESVGKKSSGGAARTSRSSSSSKKLDDLFDKVAKETVKSDQRNKEGASAKFSDRKSRASSVSSKISGSSKKQPAKSASENSDGENNNSNAKNDSSSMLDDLLKKILKLSQETNGKKCGDDATNRKSRASSVTPARTSKKQAQSDSENSEEQNSTNSTKIEIRRKRTSSVSINRKTGASSVTSTMTSTDKKQLSSNDIDNVANEDNDTPNSVKKNSNSKKSARSTNTVQVSEDQDNSSLTEKEIRRKRSNSSSSTGRKTGASSVTSRKTNSSNRNQSASDTSINEENDATKSLKKSGRPTNTRQGSSVTSKMSGLTNSSKKRTASPSISENDFRQAKRRNTLSHFTVNLSNLNVTCSRDEVANKDSSDKFSTNKARDGKEATPSVVTKRQSSRSSSLFSRSSFRNDSERTTSSLKESRIDESLNSSCSLVVNVNHSENTFGDSTQSPSKKDDSHNSPFVRLVREVNPSSSDDSNSPKKLRKLFNPTEFSPKLSMTDAREREEYRLAKLKNKKQKNKTPTTPAAGDFLDPNNVLISRKSSVGKSAQTNTMSSTGAAVGDPSCSSQDESDEEFVSSKSAVTVRENKKNKKARRRSSVRVAHNSDDDEYILEHEPKTQNNNNNNENDETNMRRSRRISVSQKSINYKLSSTSTSSETTDSDRLMPVTPTSALKRRSTLEFQSQSALLSQKKRRLKLDRSLQQQVTSIVCTKFHRHEVLKLEQIVSKLGKFEVEYVVTKRTSHLLVGEAKRTINMLRAIARGCWILKPEWLTKSNRAGRWLNEEEFELTEYSPAVQQNRLQRQAFGSDYSMDIFQNCGYIYISKKNKSPNSVELKELVELCKGKVTTISRNAIISVGEILKQETAICVDHRWILDSIVFNKVKPFKNYLMQEVNAPESPHY